jgi:hypothetical protein
MKVIGAALLLAAIYADALLHATTPCTKVGLHVRARHACSIEQSLLVLRA